MLPVWSADDSEVGRFDSFNGVGLPVKDFDSLIQLNRVSGFLDGSLH